MKPAATFPPGSLAALILGAILMAIVVPVHAEPQTGALEIVSPKGGGRWAAGSQHYILWKSSLADPDQNPRAEYTTDNGEHWRKLPARAAGAGRILWHLPNHLFPQCRVRVFDPRGGASGESKDFSIVTSQAVDGYQWERVTPQAAFAARDGAGTLVFKNRMWLLGGWNPNDKQHFPRITNNEVWSSTDGATWGLVKTNTFLDRSFNPTNDWEGRHTGGYVAYQDKMWLVGGDANQGHYQFDVWNSADGQTWTLVNKDRPVPWGPRALHYTAVFKDKIWVIGGQTMPAFAEAAEAFYRDVWTTTDGVNWQKIIPQEPSWPARGMIGGNVVFNDRIWILGGGTFDTPTTPERKFYNDVWSSADGVHWTCHAVMAPWETRQYHEVAVFDGQLWVLEGFKDHNRKDVWYSRDGVNWYSLPSRPWDPRHAASVFVHDNALWIAAGNNMAPDVWKLQRHPPSAPPALAAPEPAGTGMLLNVAVGLFDIEDRTGHIFDEKNPERQVYPVKLSKSGTTIVPIFGNIFGLNAYGLKGENIYAQMHIDRGGGKLYFDKWIDGGAGLELIVDNAANPPEILIRRTGR